MYTLWMKKETLLTYESLEKLLNKRFEEQDKKIDKRFKEQRKWFVRFLKEKVMDLDYEKIAQKVPKKSL